MTNAEAVVFLNQLLGYARMRAAGYKGTPGHPQTVTDRILRDKELSRVEALTMAINALQD
jgi:hypothetical protein